VVKGAKAYILKEKFTSFKMKEDESVPEMLHRLQVLVNDLKALGEEVKDKDFSHKFLRCLPSIFGTLVTILVKSGLDTMTPKQVLGNVMTDDTYRDDDEKEEKKEKKDEMDDEKMSLFMKRFGKFMVKKGYHTRRKKSSSKSKDYLVAQYPYNSDNEDDDKKDKKKDKKKKEKKDKMTFKKKKSGSYVVTWDSDASSSDDDDDSDNDKSTKKALASIAINKKHSLFDTPSTCFMAKATKVQTCDDGCDEEHDNESESDDDDEPTKNELIDMLEDAKEHFDIKRRECKDLRKELKALKQVFDELNASHERLEEAHEKLIPLYLISKMRRSML
jgi:hypothetical protein